MKRKLTNFMGSSWGQRITILVLVMIVMAIFQPRFFRLSNVYSILLSISVYGIMACGMLFVILTGNIDLCQGSAAAMSAVFMTQYVMAHDYSTESIFIGIGIGLASCVLLGLFHGIETAYLKVPAFILTIATQYAVYGMMDVYTKSNYLTPAAGNLYSFIGSGKVFGIPMPIIIFVVYAAICAIVLGCTKFGRRIYLVGGNPEAAELIGINSKFYRVAAYVISGISAGLGGIVLACLNMQAAFTTAKGYEGKVLTAMVVGGINLAGGEGGIPGALFGALFVGIISNLLVLLDVPADYQSFVQGVIIIVAIAMNVQSQRRSMGLTGVSKKLFETDKEKDTTTAES